MAPGFAVDLSEGMHVKCSVGAVLGMEPGLNKQQLLLLSSGPVLGLCPGASAAARLNK